MGLFDVFKAHEADAPQIETLMIMRFDHSKGFRGFKRIRLATYGDDIAQENIKKLLNTEISDVTLVVKVDNINFTEPMKFVDVSADGLHIGTYYPNGDDRYVDSILSGKVDKTHLRLEYRDDRYVGYLFVHLAE